MKEGTTALTNGMRKISELRLARYGNGVRETSELAHQVRLISVSVLGGEFRQPGLFGTCWIRKDVQNRPEPADSGVELGRDTDLL